MDSIYVTLQSDSSLEFFSKTNTITDFRNHLSCPLDIIPELFEVALVQCSYVYNPPYLKRGTQTGTLRRINKINKVTFNGKTTFDPIIYNRYLTKNIRDSEFLILSSVSDDYAEKFYSSAQKYQNDNLLELNDFDQDFSLVYESEVDLYVNEKPNSWEEFHEVIRAALNAYLIDLKIHKVELGLLVSFNFVSDQVKPVGLRYELSEFICDLYGICKVNKVIDLGKPFETSKFESLTSADFPLKIGRVKYFKNFKTIGKLRFNNTIDLSKNANSIFQVQTSKEKIRESRLFDRLDDLNDPEGLITEIAYSSEPQFLSQDVYALFDLIMDINSTMQNVKFRIKNNYVFATENEGKNFEKLELNEQISAILGFSEKKLTGIKGETQGLFHPFFGHGMQQMYIYLNCITNQHIGSGVAPLLRIIPYKGEIAKTTTLEFNHHHYIPLKNQVIDSFHLYIRSETGGIIPLELGSFSATLHFRRKKF